MASAQKITTLTLYEQYTDIIKVHPTRMFQTQGSTSLTQFVPNVTMKIFYHEQTVSSITLDSSTLSKIPLLNQQTAL